MSKQITFYYFNELPRKVKERIILRLGKNNGLSVMKDDDKQIIISVLNNKEWLYDENGKKLHLI